MKSLLVFSFIFSFFLSIAQAKMLERKTYDIDQEWDLRQQKSWTTLAKSSEKSFKVLLQILDRSPTARKVIAKAEDRASTQEQTLLSILSPGETSLSDMTLVRRFSSSDPSKVTYATQGKIYLNRSLYVFDAALDLIHELTHFSLRDTFNPYRENFTIKEFIASTIEGRGGEVDAYMVECQVLSEIAPQLERSHSVCQKIRDPKTFKLSRYHAIREFYKVGDEYSAFNKSIAAYNIERGEVSAVSDDEPTFISSAYNLPYPLAAIKEYESIMSRACKNDLKRMALFTSKIGRSPASAEPLFKKALDSIKGSYENRCKRF